MGDGAHLYEVCYYRDDPRNNKFGPVTRKQLVLATGEDDARTWVRENVDGFDGFPDDHVTKRVTRERDLAVTSEVF